MTLESNYISFLEWDQLGTVFFLAFQVKVDGFSLPLMQIFWWNSWVTFAVLIVASDIFMKIASSFTELPTNPSFLSIFSRPLRWCREDICDSRARDLYIYLVVSGFFWICFKRFLLANATAFGLNLLSYFSLKIDQYLSINIPQDTTESTSNSMTTDFFRSKVASRLPRKLHTLTPKNGVPCNSCAGKPQKSGKVTNTLVPESFGFLVDLWK